MHLNKFLDNFNLKRPTLSSKTIEDVILLGMHIDLMFVGSLTQPQGTDRGRCLNNHPCQVL
eukprot:6461414-Amphidinium_carterae.1